MCSSDLGKTLFHGPLLQAVSEVRIGSGSLVARAADIPLTAAEAGLFSASRSVVNSFAADVMLQMVLVYARHSHGCASLPSSMGKIEFLR